MFINMSSYAEITKSTETDFPVSIGIGRRFNIHCWIILLLDNSLYHRSYIFSWLLLLLLYFFGIDLFHALYLSHIWFLHILCYHLSLFSKCWFFYRMIQGVILLFLNFLGYFWLFNFYFHGGILNYFCWLFGFKTLNNLRFWFSKTFNNLRFRFNNDFFFYFHGLSRGFLRLRWLLCNLHFLHHFGSWRFWLTAAMGVFCTEIVKVASRVVFKLFNKGEE